MEKCILIANAVDNPVIITELDGKIIHMNEGARRLLQISNLSGCKNAAELCPDLMTTGKNDSGHNDIVIANLRYSVNVISFMSDAGVNGKMLIFKDSFVCSKLVSQVLEAIDEGVTVTNVDGYVENLNKMALVHIGLRPDEREESIGIDLQEALRNRKLLIGLLNPIVIREKKTIRKNLEYSNGKVVTYTGTPVFDDEHNLKHVVLTGRDVSRLVQLESQLNELEKLKNDYYSQLMELVQYRGGKGPVCSSKKMEYVLGLALKVAPTDAPIFLTGESGVGKEEVARFIHGNSDRCDKPFIAINCAAIPEQLFESELFGFAGGSFTGANKNGKKGLLEESNGGTFFLDEIGDLPFAVQSKLLRVVQEGKMYRIGSTNTIDLDVRYISATNRPENELSNSSNFRRDLYYRLCVVPINIPPLRERKDDIIPLTSYFLNSFNQKYRKNVRIGNQVLRKMARLEWPGNVRELKNLVERMVILSSDETVDEAQLKIALEMGNTGTNELISVNGIIPLNEAHDLIDKILIEEAYAQYKTIVDTAKALGIDPSTIHRKIKEGKIALGRSADCG